MQRHLYGGDAYDLQTDADSDVTAYVKSICVQRILDTAEDEFLFTVQLLKQTCSHAFHDYSFHAHTLCILESDHCI